MTKLISLNETGHVQSLAVLPSTDVDLFTAANNTTTYIEVDENTSVKVGDHYDVETGNVTAVEVAQSIVQNLLTKVSPVEFKLLFTIQEKVKMRAARTTDPVVEDFFDLVDDPRLTLVDLSIPPVIEMLNYLETTGLIGEGRASQILATPGTL